MTTTSNAGLFSRYVLENPYPLAGALILVGLVLAALGLRDGRADRLRACMVPLLLGAAVWAASALVVTASEHARTVVRTLVSAVEASDVNGAMATMAPDVRADLGSPMNVAHDSAFIKRGLTMVTDRYELESTRITRLDTEPASDADVTVFLTVWTTTEGWGPNRSQWILRVERDAGQRWLITDLTCVSVNDRTPPSNF